MLSGHKGFLGAEGFGIINIHQQAQDIAQLAGGYFFALYAHEFFREIHRNPPEKVERGDRVLGGKR